MEDKSLELDCIHLKLGEIHQLISFLGVFFKLIDVCLRELWSTQTFIPKIMEEETRVVASELVYLQISRSILLYLCLGRPYHFKFFKGSLPQILLGPFLNTQTQMNPVKEVTRASFFNQKVHSTRIRMLLPLLMETCLRLSISDQFSTYVKFFEKLTFLTP